MGGMDQHLDQVAERVHYDVALAPFRFLVTVIVPAFARGNRLDALRIDNPMTRGGPPAVFSVHFVQGIRHFPPRPAPIPMPPMVVHGLPRRKVTRQHPPLATCLVQVE